MLKCNTTDFCIDIEDLGVTLRTLLAVGAAGYRETGRRKWGVRYKNAMIGNIQVASTRPPARITTGCKAVEPRNRAAIEGSNPANT